MFAVTIQSYTEMRNLTLGNYREPRVAPHLHGHTIRQFLNQPGALECNFVTPGCGNKSTQKEIDAVLHESDGCVCVCVLLFVFSTCDRLSVCVCVSERRQG